MMWLTYLILTMIAIEALIVWTYSWTKKNMPDYSIWVILGSKVLKLLIAAVAIVAVKYLADGIPFKDFCIAVCAVYLICLIFEVLFFLKKKK